MKTIVGLFDDFQQAQTAVEELMRSGVNRDDINLIANDTEGKLKEYTSSGHEHTAAKGGAGTGAVLGGLAGLAVGVGALVIPGIGPVITAGTLASALASTAAGAGIGAVAGGVIGALVHVGVPEDEAQSYAEGLRRGGTLVTAKVDDTIAPRAQQILQRNNMVDVKQRETMWRQQGWHGYDAKAKPYTSEELRKEREQWNPQRGTGQMNQQRSNTQSMPVVEEQLHVGKEEVQKGGVRLTQQTTEKPVEKDVTLREEKVNVERRPVDRPANESDKNAFQNRTIEVKETAEQPVVSKTARVVEEVNVTKDVQERKQTVKDNVKRTDVNVEPLGKQSGQDFASLEPMYRSDFQSRYGTGQRKYEEYAPAYRYGYELANDQRYQNQDWNTVERSARTDWERRGSGSWQDFKDSIRYAWEQARGKR